VRKVTTGMTIVCFLFAAILNSPASGYVMNTTLPQAGSCPQPNRWNLSLASPLSRRWSTYIPRTAAILTVAGSGTDAQLDEIEQAISDSFGAWSGVAGTTFNQLTYLGMFAQLTRVSDSNSCSND